METEIVCLGEALIELNQLPEKDQHLFYSSFGGDVSNVAIAIARQGSSAGIISLVGDDLFGDQLLELWQREGVNHTHVSKISNASTGIYFVTHDSSGHHFSYFRKNSAASQITPENLPSTYIASAKVLHISAISQAISSSSNDTVNAAIRIAVENSVLISYDTNLRLKLWSLEQARATIQQTIPYVDFLFPSLEDSILLTGLREPTAIASYYLEKGAKLVALKLGAEGVLLATVDGFHRIPGKTVETIDATGAGDSFDGAFLSEWLKHRNPMESAQYANAAAALSTIGFGAVDAIPYRLDVENFIKSYSN
jgi:2-dehydro-3-deoxygluconokinase